MKQKEQTENDDEVFHKAAVFFILCLLPTPLLQQRSRNKGVTGRTVFLKYILKISLKP